MREDVPRGRIWTAAELADLLAIPTVTPAHARTIASVRAGFEGEVVAVHPAVRAGAAPSEPLA